MSQRCIYKHGETTFIGGPEAPEKVTIVNGIRDEVTIPVEDVFEFVRLFHHRVDNACLDEAVERAGRLEDEVKRLRTAIHAAAAMLTEGDPISEICELAARMKDGGWDDEEAMLIAVAKTIRDAARILVEAAPATP